MADVATSTQPRQIVNAHQTQGSLPNTLAIPQSAQSSYGISLALSPVTEGGSYEFDRIIKAGELWKSRFIVLRPTLLSIYRDKDETKLRYQIRLGDLTAVARQKNPKRKERHGFGLFTPSQNYHLEVNSEREAQEWVEHIRREARMDQNAEEMDLASPGGAQGGYYGFGRSIDEYVSSSHDDRGGYSSSDLEALVVNQRLPKQRDRHAANAGTRKPSEIEYSGAEHGSISDFSDAGPAARMSALSLAQTDGRPSTSSMFPPGMHSIYGHTPGRPPMGPRNPSQLSNLGLNLEQKVATRPADDARVIHHGWIDLWKSKSAVRPWKRIWMVLRSKALAMYKNEEEYSATLVLAFSSIIDVVEINPINNDKDKTNCMQIIREERNYRFCALNEDSLVQWLGAFKSLLQKRKASEGMVLAATTPVGAVS
nr:putative ph domain-containing protein pb16a4.02c [Quercus suber]